jgi:hypothetical protein
MKLKAIAAVAALLVTSLAPVAAPADAQNMRERTVVQSNDNGRVVRTRTVVRTDHREMRMGMRDDRGRHNGWRNQTRRTCRTVWRHGRRDRVCRVVRWH